MIFLDHNFKANRQAKAIDKKTGKNKMMLTKCIHSAVLIKHPQNISQLYKKMCKHVNS